MRVEMICIDHDELPKVDYGVGDAIIKGHKSELLALAHAIMSAVQHKRAASESFYRGEGSRLFVHISIEDE